MARKENFSVGRLTVDYINGYMASTLGLGPGMGDIFYLVPTDASTARYKSWLEAGGVEGDHIFSTFASAYDATTACRNDVVAVLPGTYTVTASDTLDKNQTHVIGLGGPNQRHVPTTATNGTVKFYCATTGIDSIFSVTGHYIQLHNFQTQNTYSSNDNRCDIEIKGKNTYMKGIFSRGGNGENQLNHADGGVPLIIATGTAGAGNGFTAEDCIFGSAGNSARTVGAGAVLFEGGAVAGFAPVFRNCTFEMRCETSGSTDPKLIHLADDYAVDRYLLFDNCFFYNFWENMGGAPDYVIVDACATTHSIVLKNSTQMGFDNWCDVATYCFTDMPAADDEGGKAAAVDASV